MAKRVGFSAALILMALSTGPNIFTSAIGILGTCKRQPVRWPELLTDARANAVSIELWPR